MCKCNEAMNVGVWAFINVAVYPAIRRCDDEEFDDTSKKSEKKNFIINKPLRPVQNQGIGEQAKK